MVRIVFALTLAGLTNLSACQTNRDAAQAITPASQTVSVVPVPAYYICYKNNDDDLALSIGFDNSGTAMLATQKHQAAPRTLKAHKKREFQQGGAHPTITDHYEELVNGEVNGSYKLTHSGAWDYARYTPADGGEVLRFTIDHGTAIRDGAYRTSVCF